MSRRGSLQHLDNGGSPSLGREANGHHHNNHHQERTASIMRPAEDMRGSPLNQQRGIPLPGMVGPAGVRSLHGSPMHMNPMHGFVNPLGPGALGHPMSMSMPPGSVASVGVMAGMPMPPHSPNARQGRHCCYCLVSIYGCVDLYD